MTDSSVTDPSLVATARVVLKPRKVLPFFGRHPWVLESAIERVEGAAADGDPVDLISDRGQWVARGLYNSRSRIRVRLYSWAEGEPLAADLWRRRLDVAIDLRERLGYQDPRGATRLVASEADGLGGLTVDRYGPYLAVQVTALGMARRLPELLPLLVERVQPRGIVLRTDREMSKLEGLKLDDGHGWGEAPDGPVFIEEHGLRYGVDLAAGQKTGFYLDQRENRRAAAAYMAGRHVLDVCCFSGGFSVAALKLGQAKQTLGIDSSAKAVALAEANAQLNEVAGAHFEVGDCFERLHALAEEGRKFDAVVLDPPKFARARQAVPEALKAYHHLNRLAVALLEPQGVLVTCSCSGHVSREDFVFTLADVARRTGRDLQLLELRGAAPDHPVAVTCLETEYLKCAICRVV